MGKRSPIRPEAGKPVALPVMPAAAAQFALPTAPVAVARFALPAMLVAVALLWSAPGSAQRGQPVLGRPIAEPADTTISGADVARGWELPPDVGLVPGAESVALLPAWAAGSIRRLERRLASHVAADDVGSIAAAIVVDDAVVWQAAFGLADRETGALAGATTLYRAASISKSITALVLLALVERGAVGLDDPVEPYIPELRHLANRAPDHRPITFRDLASHTAGLAREPARSHAARGPYRDWRRKLISSIASTDAVAAPGEAYLYSNVGYSLLGLALERVADEPYETLVRTLVAEPLGMERSHLAVPGGERGRLATGYVNLPGDTIDPRVPRAEHRGRGYQVPGAGVYSTVGDLARLAMAMTGALGDVPVTAASRATALTDHAAARQSGARSATAATDSPTHVARTGYGLGFQLHRVGDTTIAGHSGSIPGYSAYLAFDPETRVGVVLLRNYNHGRTNLGAMAARMLLELGEVRRGVGGSGL